MRWFSRNWTPGKKEWWSLKDGKQTWTALPLPQATVLSNHGHPEGKFRESPGAGILEEMELSLEKSRQLEFRREICIETDLQRSAEGPYYSILAPAPSKTLEIS